MKYLIVACLVFQVSCMSLQNTTTLKVANISSSCTTLDNKYLVWGAIAAGTGFLSGGGGLVTALTDDSIPRLAVGLTSLGIGLISAVSVFLAQNYAKQYTTTCK
jgi:hypothetical protein